MKVLTFVYRDSSGDGAALHDVFLLASTLSIVEFLILYIFTLAS